MLKSEIILLAAGHSTRMGTPKPLLDIHGKTLLEFQLDALSQMFCKPIVVLGANSLEILNAIPNLDTRSRVLINPCPDKGQFSSLRIGLEQTAGKSTFILPLDTPAPNRSVWIELESHSKSFDVVVPKYKDKCGHPVWLSQSFTTALLLKSIVESEQRLDIQIRKLPANHYCALPVSDPGILVDLDFPQDYTDYLSTVNELF